jgi:Rap1a immunity proteins
VKIAGLLTVLSVVLCSSPVQAQGLIVPGPIFAGSCNDKDPVKYSACVGFVAGVVDSYINSHQMCIPPQTSPKEVSDFVTYYINTNRHLVNQPAVNIVVLALKARWPCRGLGGPEVVLRFRGF